MRQVRIPAIDWSAIGGVEALIPVKVNWPELQLTEEQVMANVNAWLADRPTPYPDHSIFEVVVKRPKDVAA